MKAFCYHLPMGQLLIRNVPDAEIAELKAQAERENISLEQRLRNLVAAAARKEREDFWELARRSREATRALNLDVDALLRASRTEFERDPVGGR